MKRLCVNAPLAKVEKNDAFQSLCAVVISACNNSINCFHVSKIHYFKRWVKSNPFETSTGRYDKSFEKLSLEIEQRMPSAEDMGFKGTLADKPFGSNDYERAVDTRREELKGIISERPAAQQARSYFTGADLSPAALHVRSPRLKVAQEQHRLQYDKRILKTSMESDEYYYPLLTFAEKQRRNRMILSCWCAALISV